MAGFYAARSGTIQPLPWTNFAPPLSYDYDKTLYRAAVVPAAIKWSDLGAWDAVWKSGARDEDDNLRIGHVTLSALTNSLVMSEKHHVAVPGLDDVAVVASEDAVYVGRLSSAPSVSELVKPLEADSATCQLTETHRTSYRPWGVFSRAGMGAVSG